MNTTKTELTPEELGQYEQILLDENLLFELNAIPQMVVNKNHVIIRINQKFRKLFGYEAKDVLGKQTLLLTPSFEQFVEYSRYLEQTNEEQLVSKELQYKKQNGSLLWVKLEGNPVHKHQDEVLVLWSFIDVTKEVQYREKLKELASRDPLTQLYNRRVFSEIALSVMKLSQRQRQLNSILIIDIDKFKSINDTYGHIAGDTVIQHLARTIQSVSRKSDITCRWGGEEFLILLPNTIVENAFIYAQNLRRHIENSEACYHDDCIRFTISIGVAAVSDDLEASIIKADRALYEAKNQGRNRVVLAPI